MAYRNNDNAILGLFNNDLDGCIQSAKKLLIDLEEASKEHEKGGVCFRTTKRLLEMYPLFKYELVYNKTIQTLEVFDAYGLLDQDNNAVMTIDFLLSIPDELTICRNNLKDFCVSHESKVCEKFARLLEAGLTALKTVDEKDYAILSEFFLKNIGEERSSQEVLNAVKERGISISNSSLYRERDNAISKLSVIIFGALGERHPRSYGGTLGFSRKYEAVFHLADAIFDVAEEKKNGQSMESGDLIDAFDGYLEEDKGENNEKESVIGEPESDSIDSSGE